jgi:hypothetical protein
MLRIEIAVPGFFSIKPKLLDVEEIPNTDRTYFIHEGRIVAVAKQGRRER